MLKKHNKIKIIEVTGIIIDFIGALLLASAILHYSQQSWETRKEAHWERQKEEIEYIDEHLQRTKKITAHAIVFLVVGFFLTITAILCKK